MTYDKNLSPELWYILIRVTLLQNASFPLVFHLPLYIMEQNTKKLTPQPEISGGPM